MELLGKKEIYIFGMRHDVATYQDKSVNDTSMGTSDSKRGIIKLCEGMPADIAEQTLLHEIIHLIDLNLGTELTEKQVLGITSGIYSVIKENNL
jgi:hypothetical protein